jgi:hypothetical protein
MGRQNSSAHVQTIGTSWVSFFGLKSYRDLPVGNAMTESVFMEEEKPMAVMDREMSWID